MTRKWFGAAATLAAAMSVLFMTNATPSFARQATPTPMAKKMPPRDAKGRFMKASPTPAATPAPMKKMPMRDAKGRFMKASPSPAPTPMAKKLPMRDAKGRFMKASPTPAAPK